MAKKMPKTECGRNINENIDYVPHRGSLCKVKQLTKKVEKNASAAVTVVTSLESYIDLYAITIHVTRDDGICVDMRTTAGTGTHELHFKSEQFSFMENIFAILDTESTGIVNKATLQEFVMLRCPVFKRRDSDILQYQKNRDNWKTTGNFSCDAAPHDHVHDGDISRTNSEFLSFEQVWKAVISCALETTSSFDYRIDTIDTIGIEAWMIFCRFISLAQYLDAKRRFSGRHLQTLQNRQGSGNDLEEEDQEQELIIVDLPPLEKPSPLDVYALLDYEYATRDKGGIPLPELDLDHSYISLHDESKKLRMKEVELDGSTRRDQNYAMPVVEVSVFGNENDIHVGNYSPPNELEFIIRFAPSNDDMRNFENVVVVKRSFKDLEWLHRTFESHKNLGGTLCGRILPPFPSKIIPTSRGVEDSGYGTGSSLGSIANSSNRTAVAVASAGVGMVSSAAKTAKTLFWGGLSSSKSISTPVVSVVKKAMKSRGLGSPSSSTTSKVVPTALKSSYSKQNSFLKKSTNTAGSKARQLERYLNYLLGHPALSTSFPLNLILKVSQASKLFLISVLFKIRTECIFFG